jgi:hypothetical protein
MDFVLGSPGKPVKGRGSYHIMSKITVEIVKKFSSLMFGVKNLQCETSIPLGVPRLHQTEVALSHDGIYEQGPRHQGRHTLSAKVKHI